LNATEKKYQVYELECLAVVWAVEVFKKYIRNSVVRTDCSALQWLKTREHGARVMRWVMRLQEFDLDIQYRKGKNSCNVDGLTRDSTAPLRPYGEDSVEQLYETNNVAVTTKLKAYLKSVMPKDDQENTDDGMDEKHVEDTEGEVSEHKEHGQRITATGGTRYGRRRSKNRGKAVF
jgi:hypothetical protein